jgi:hypothetical protein
LLEFEPTFLHSDAWLRIVRVSLNAFAATNRSHTAYGKAREELRYSSLASGAEAGCGATDRLRRRINTRFAIERHGTQV